MRCCPPAMPAWERLPREWPHCRLEASGEAVGLPAGPDGQQRGRPPQPRRRRSRSSRTCRASARPSPTARFFRHQALRRGLPRSRSSGGAALHLMGLDRPGRRPRHRRAHRRHGRAGAPARAAGGSRAVPRLHRWPRHAAALGGRLPARARCGASPARATSRPSSAATTPWTATGAGSARSGRTTRSSTARGCRRVTPSGGHRWRPRARRKRRVHPADGRRRLIRCISNGDVVVHLNFRADRARQLTQALALRQFDAFDRGAARTSHVTTLTEYQAPDDLPVAGRLPARSPSTRWPRTSRAWA